MILAGAALGQIALGGINHAVSANFLECSAHFALQLSVAAALTLADSPSGVSTYPPIIDHASNLLIAANNKKSTTTTALDLTGLSVTVADASAWPASGAITLDLVIIPARTPTSNEIAYYISRAGNVLTLDARAQGGTTAKTWAIGSSVEMRYTAEHHNLHSQCIIALQTELSTAEASIDGKADDSDIVALEASKVAKSGDTMTGTLTLAGGPILDLHAATKRYVDYVGPTVYNAKNYGITGDGESDDTAAINTLQTTVFDAGGGRIYFPRGVYLIAGPLLEPEGHNAQIPIPVLSQHEATRTIEWVGELAPPTTCSIQNKPTGSNHTIIQSTLTDASGNASLIGGAQMQGVGTTNGVMFNIKDMVFELPPNPSLTALDFSNQMGNRIQHVLIHDGAIDENHPFQPTHSNSYGIKLPPTNHSSRVDVDALNIVGLYTGVRCGELAYGTFITQACWIGLEVPFAYHPSKFNLVGMYGCPHGVMATGDGPCGVRIDVLSLQDNTGQGPAWQNNVADIYDPTNMLHGSFTWYNVLAGVSQVHTIVKNGGVNFIGTELW
jgi:hypothetical protein